MVRGQFHRRSTWLTVFNMKGALSRVEGQRGEHGCDPNGRSMLVSAKPKAKTGLPRAKDRRTKVALLKREVLRSQVGILLRVCSRLLAGQRDILN
jgi:hypothetical protein